MAFLLSPYGAFLSYLIGPLLLLYVYGKFRVVRVTFFMKSGRKTSLYVKSFTTTDNGSTYKWAKHWAGPTILDINIPDMTLVTARKGWF